MAGFNLRSAVATAAALLAGALPLAAAALGAAPFAHTQAAERTVWSGVYSAAQAERGTFVYTRYCERCHGADLLGPAMGRHLPGQSPAPAMVGDEFRWKWNELTAADLMKRVRDMPPGNPGALSREDSVDVLAYILSRNGMPAGPHELPATIPELSMIAFAAVAPSGR
jgi:cytochrome c